MALFHSDGSIVLSTKVDTKGIKQGIKSIKGKSGEASAIVKKDIDGISDKLKQLSRVMATVFSVKTLIDFSQKASDAALQTEASVQRIIGIYGTASDVVGDFIDNNAQALGMAKSAATDIATTYGNIFNTFADQETNANLTADYLRMTAVVASKTGRTIDDVQDRIRSGLLGNTEAIEDLGIFVNVSTIEMTKAFRKYANDKSWAQLDAKTQNQIRAMAILEQSTKQYGNEIARTSMLAKTRLASAWEDLKNTWGKAVNTVLVPAMERLTIIIDAATDLLKIGLNDTGGILGNIEKTADKSDKIVDNQNKLNNELKETDALTQRVLAGFDDIQKLGSGENVDSKNLDAFKYVSESETTDNTEYREKVEAVKKTLQEIIRWLPTALIAIGLMLLGMGRIGWGIGFIIAGAKLYDIQEEQYKDKDISKKIDDIKETVEKNMGKLLIGLGVILCACGNFPIGLGAIIAGLNWEEIKEAADDLDEKTVSEKLDQILKMLTPILMDMGVLLIFIGIIAVATGNLKGIGFIIAGVTEVALFYKEDPEAAQKWIEEHVPDLMAIGGMVLLVAGLMIALSGKPVIGVAMMSMGAGSVAWGTTNGDGDGFATWLKNSVSAHADEIRAIGSIAAIVGVALILAGHPIAGAAVLTSGISVLGIEGVISDTEEKRQKDKNQVGLNRYRYATQNLDSAQKGTLLQAVMEKGLLTPTDISELNAKGTLTKDFLVKMLKLYYARLFEVEDLVSDLEINQENDVPKLTEEQAMQLLATLRDSSNSFANALYVWLRKYIKIPKYATGTVIPPNTAHLAIIGDQKKGYNIETPLDTMISAFNTALDSRGAGEPVHVHLYLDGKEIYDNVVNRNRANTRITGVNELAY